jgi:heme-degrading monooxygenase HmoA
MKKNLIPRAGFKSICLISILSLFFVSFRSTLSHPTSKLMKHQADTTFVANDPTAFKVSRIWHGWTTKEDAASFEKMLVKEILPGIERNKPKGYLGVQLLKREVANEVEFTTIMWFESIEAVKNFAGEDYEKAHIDPKVASLLLRYDATSAHLQLRYTTPTLRQ